MCMFQEAGSVTRQAVCDETGGVTRKAVCHEAIRCVTKQAVCHEKDTGSTCVLIVLCSGQQCNSAPSVSGRCNLAGSGSINQNSRRHETLPNVKLEACYQMCTEACGDVFFTRKQPNITKRRPNLT